MGKFVHGEDDPASDECTAVLVKLRMPNEDGAAVANDAAT